MAVERERVEAALAEAEWRLAAGESAELHALADAGRADEAVDVLERALALRREKGDPALVESTERALERASALLRQP